MTDLSWTELDKIKRVSITLLNSYYLELIVTVIVTNSQGQPMWFVYHDDENHEVMIPWVSIASITILERKE